MFRRSLEPPACHDPPTHGNAETLVLDIQAAMGFHEGWGKAANQFEELAKTL